MNYLKTFQPCLIAGYCRACIRNNDLKCCKCADGTCDCYKKNCFPANAKVKLESGKSVKMSELQIGDKVQRGMFIPNYP